MPGKEYDPTNKEGRGRETKKGLPSKSHESSEKKIPSEDTRGPDSLMQKTVYKERKAAKKTKESPSKPSSVQDLQQAFDKQQAMYEELLRENECMSAEIGRLRAKNEELSEQLERRREQKRKAQARYRKKNSDEYKEYHRQYMQDYRADKKSNSESDKEDS